MNLDIKLTATIRSSTDSLPSLSAGVGCVPPSSSLPSCCRVHPESGRAAAQLLEGIQNASNSRTGEGEQFRISCKLCKYLLLLHFFYLLSVVIRFRGAPPSFYSVLLLFKCLISLIAQDLYSIMLCVFRVVHAGSPLDSTRLLKMSYNLPDSKLSFSPF